MPHELLLQVLRLLPQQDRLAACAVTCKALHTAAGLATQEVQLSTNELRQQQADAVIAWLLKYSSQVVGQFCMRNSSFFISSSVTLNLPWQRLSQLTCLTLRGVALQSADCSTSGSSSSLCGLGQLSLMQRLPLKKLGKPQHSGFDAEAYTASLGQALGQLVQLTELSLSPDYYGWLGPAVLAGASNLSNLQYLKAKSLGSRENPVQFADLPCSLTALHLIHTDTTTASGNSGSSSSSSCSYRCYGS
jgi:hypothetical protein